MEDGVIVKSVKEYEETKAYIADQLEQIYFDGTKVTDLSLSKLRLKYANARIVEDISELYYVNEYSDFKLPGHCGAYMEDSVDCSTFYVILGEDESHIELLQITGVDNGVYTYQLEESNSEILHISQVSIVCFCIDKMDYSLKGNYRLKYIYVKPGVSTSEYRTVYIVHDGSKDSLIQIPNSWLEPAHVGMKDDKYGISLERETLINEYGMSDIGIEYIDGFRKKAIYEIGYQFDYEWLPDNISSDDVKNSNIVEEVIKPIQETETKTETKTEIPTVEEVEEKLDIEYINDFYDVNFNFDKVIPSRVFPDNMCIDKYMLYMVSNIDSFYDGSILNDKIMNRDEILEELNISSDLYSDAIAIRSEEEMRFCYIFKYNGDIGKSEIKAALVAYVDKLLEDNLTDELIAPRINSMYVTACNEVPYIYLVYEVRDEESDGEDYWTIYNDFNDINFIYTNAIYDVLKYVYLKDVKYNN